MKLTVDDIRIIGEGMQAKELIINRYGSIPEFIKKQKITLSEKAIATYLHQWKITSSNFRFRMVYAFDSDSYEELILNEEAQFKKLIDTINSDLQSYNVEEDKYVLDKLLDLRQKYKISRHSGELYRLIGEYYHNINQNELAIKNIRIAISMEEEPILLMSHNSRIGFLYYYEKEWLEANTYYEEAEKIRIENKITDNAVVSLHYYRYGILNSKFNSFSNARSLFEKVIHTTADKSLAGSALLNIGLSYKEQSNFESALAYYAKAILIFEEIRDFKRIGMIYNNIADLYRVKKDYIEALKYYEKVREYWGYLGDREKTIYTNTYYQIQTEMGNDIDFSDFSLIIDNIENLCPQKQFVIELFNTLIEYGKMKDVAILFKIRNIVNILKKKTVLNEFRKELLAIYGDISTFLDEGGYESEEVHMHDFSSGDGVINRGDGIC